jgi:hypothetical protein
MREKNHKPNIIPARYFVCFFDALGTKESLFNQLSLKNTPEKLLQISNHAFATHEFLSGIEDEIQAVKHSPFDYMTQVCKNLELPDDIRKKFAEDVMAISCGYQQFSDTTMFYVRDVRDDGHVGLFSEILFQNLILSFSLSLIKVMAKGLFYRGTLDYGIGWELDDNCLFGPVVQTAYEIEEKHARWPRIVISEEMKKRFDEMSRGVRSIASPSKMICLDPDGRTSLDYWSIGAVDNYLKILNSDELRQLAEAGYNNAVNQQKFFSKKMCADDFAGKLFLRYGALLSYLDDRMIKRGLFKPVKEVK